MSNDMIILLIYDEKKHNVFRNLVLNIIISIGIDLIIVSTQVNRIYKD